MAAAGVSWRKRSSRTAKAIIKKTQILNRKTESIKGTLKGDKVGLK